ncbi:MAG: EamA family transporter [Actinomycetota bacterium]
MSPHVPNPSPRRLAPLSVLLAATLFGTTGTALALGPDDTGAVSAGIMRLLIGGSGLVLVALVTGSHLDPSPRTRRSLALGAVTVASYQLCFFFATTSTGVALATVVTIGSSPLAARIIGLARRRPAPESWWFAAAALLVIGLAMLVIGNGDAATFSMVGVLAAVAAGISYAAYTECGAIALAAGSDSTVTMAAMFFGAGCLTSPLLLFQDLSWLGSSSGLSMILYLSIVTLTLSYVWFGWGLRHLPPTTVVMLTMFEPVIAAVLAIGVLDETLSAVSWTGIAIVVAGLVVVGRGAGRPVAATVAP